MVADGLTFSLLGPLAVRQRNELVVVPARMQRALLACLVHQAGSAVPLAAIVDQLWAGTAPRTASATIRNYVRRLRAILPEPVLRQAPDGYLLAISPEQVDTHQFAGLVARARKERSAEIFGAALRLWRGSPLSDLGEVPIRQLVAGQWDEVYLGALEDCLDIRIERGEHASLIADLTIAVRRYPCRERLCGQLMTALYADGRGVEALELYRTVRQRLVTGLGIEPGPSLQRVQRAILRGEPAAGSRTRPTPIAVLPSVRLPFVGRRTEVAELASRLTVAATENRAARCALYGRAGTGKSALAVYVGHLLSSQYPDGVAYVDVGGPVALPPGKIVEALVHDLGGDIESVQQYQAMLAGRRVLIILDNADSAEQVRAALPWAPGCAAIVTSRAPLSDADGTIAPEEMLHLDALDLAESTELLARIAGAGRVRAETAAVERIAELCGRLPLALRAIGSRMAVQPYWTVRSWADLLADEHRRLNQLRTAEIDVRASLSASLDRLRQKGDAVSADAVALFPVLGLLDGYVTAATVAARTRWPLVRTQRALDRLVEVQLLYSPARAHYALFELVGLLASEQARQLRGDGQAVTSLCMTCTESMSLDSTKSQDAVANPLAPQSAPQAFSNVMPLPS